MPRTLFDKLWDAHVVRELGDGWALLHIDRHLLHDLSGPPALAEVAARGLPLHDPALVFATPDHAASSQPGRLPGTFPLGGRLHGALAKLSADAGVRFYDLGQPGQGIVHVMGPELGIVLPGLTVICGDSHTCTNGGLGALAFGVGSSESTHALATQTLRQQKPKRMRIRCDGMLGAGVTAKDLALHIIGKLGAAAGVGYAIEFAGEAVRALDVESRLTLCNLTVELGARFGLIAPDARTVEWVRGRNFAPAGAAFDEAAAHWLSLASDADAVFDREEAIDATAIAPTITWGTSPEDAIAIDGTVPDPATASDDASRGAIEAALDYMGLAPRTAIAGTPVDWVFIGSCANSRLPDLRAAAEVARGRRVAAGVTAWVVPGSENVKRAAEAEGLREVFEAAGFQWREPGCSMCVAANGEQVPPQARCVSTSNRNFVGRQGPGARTHLASPAMAAAAAVTGRITDVRTLA
ncbi:MULTISPECIES: 3-isopropylmalate dehydratase large subunit [unclassified Variovorax]|jgi:3-isopropylmalate/(R)-2-methylmalate dehydratase large subunit|uniref:3-isopropylmalate dehydratase large subunit n=1 Tax=unclassified Variovorax TaxID=663243 RepID=UPI000F7E525B|nr:MULTISPECIES: 3-isopropylmalate dehydratase large subunit [unclassified Variovorax]RSZ44237.1 3-isopropylmalate dehydratase large subunit [Variovorax sp. 553]RSZ45107.1 3-isopropylmalate dehydratase large subunit [Variovorax sp. 679]